MADTDKLKPYTPRSYPTISGSDAKYIKQELQSISATISSIRSVLEEIEARLVAGGL